MGISRAIGETGAGVLQVISDFPEFEVEIETLFEMMRQSGRPLSVSLAQAAPGHDYRRILDALSRANAEGLAMRGQVAPHGIGALIGLQATINPLLGSVTYRSLMDLSLSEQVSRLRQAETRDAVLTDLAERSSFLDQAWDRVFDLGDPPNYEPDPSSSLAARAAAAGVTPESIMYDLMLGRDGAALLYLPVNNYFGGDLDAVAEMMDHPHTVPGLGDGGAHVGTICDASFATTLLTHWGRDRSPGKRFELPWLVQRQCRKTAEAVGLLDRGLLAPGYKADLNVIDFGDLRLEPPVIVHDLPAGGKRLLQRAHGYRHTVVSGQEVYRDGKPTSALPGRLVRGQQVDPGVGAGAGVGGRS